ncbi:hypothetical protein M2351_005001 [Azospirillum canadense]|nr:hypothetical protein [Azospirillum canadense]
MRKCLKDAELPGAFCTPTLQDQAASHPGHIA